MGRLTGRNFRGNGAIDSLFDAQERVSAGHLHCCYFLNRGPGPHDWAVCKETRNKTGTMNFFRWIRGFFKERFNLDEDKADEKLIIDTIKRDVHFKGPNLWALIFAIFIASIGLNVNSTAVIIGAMLISPLMGPIMGVGLGVAINDFDLLKKGIKNLVIASVVSIVASGL